MRCRVACLDALQFLALSAACAKNISRLVYLATGAMFWHFRIQVEAHLEFSRFRWRALKRFSSRISGLPRSFLATWSQILSLLLAHLNVVGVPWDISRLVYLGTFAHTSAHTQISGNFVGMHQISLGIRTISWLHLGTFAHISEHTQISGKFVGTHYDVSGLVCVGILTTP